MHARQRDDCFKKAALAFSKKQGALAQFYAHQVCVELWIINVTLPLIHPEKESLL